MRAATSAHRLALAAFAPSKGSRGQAWHSNRSRMPSGNEPATRRENVGVTIAVLLAAKETKRLDQTKVKLGTRHGNAEDAAFFFDLLGAIRAMSDGMQPSGTFRM